MNPPSGVLNKTRDMKTKRIFFIVALGLAAASTGRAQTQLYSADFANNVIFEHTTTTPPLAGPQSLTGGVAGSEWTISYTTTPGTDTTSNFFGTDGDSLVTGDWGGEAFFNTQTIDVSGWNEISIATVAQVTGGDPVNGAGEYIQWSYTLDSGTPVTGTLFDVNHPNDPLPVGFDLSENWASIDTSTASSLVINLGFNINGTGDGFDASSVVVNGITAIPEPSTFALVGILGVTAFGILRRSK
jgi:hypothetical protein